MGNGSGISIYNKCSLVCGEPWILYAGASALLIPDPLEIFLTNHAQWIWDQELWMMILMNGIGQRLIFRAQPEVEKFNLELNKKKAASFKLQASSLTAGTG